MLAAQQLAARAVGEVRAGRSLSAILGELLASAQLSGQERALTQELTYGTLRFAPRLEVYLAHLTNKPLRAGALHALLLVGLYQLEHTRAAPYAIVDHAVNAASSLGQGRAKGLVNAVLRSYLRRREELAALAAQQEAARYAHPQWWIDKLKGQYPRHWEQILAAGNQHPPMTLRVNSRKIAPQDYLTMLSARGIAARIVGDGALRLTHPVSVTDLPGFAHGLVSVQNLAAQQAAPLLDARAGMRVLDACAAPGGKSAHILELADVDLLALDLDEQRLAQVRANLDRLGLSAAVVRADARQIGQWWDGRAFDRILLDAPCTASGVVRRHPDIKCLRRASDIAAFARQQRELLAAVWPTLATHGKLLYATCSVFAEENQDQIAGFRSRYPAARAIGIELPGAHDGQIIPDDDRDGFFYALLEKT